VIQITGQGEMAIEKAWNLNTPRGTVLALLYEIKQGVEVEDIMQQTHMDETKAATIVRSLINDGLAKEV